MKQHLPIIVLAVAALLYLGLMLTAILVPFN